jgi:hypothetical protein
MEMLKDLDLVEWSSYPIPDYQPPGRVPAALRFLASPDQWAERDVGSEFRFAVGNDHAGTYFPVVLAALPFILEIILNGPPEARNAALAIVEDLTYFQPEYGFEVIQKADGEPADLEGLFRAELSGWRQALEQLAALPEYEDSREMLHLLLGRMNELGL